jgi:transaldolase
MTATESAVLAYKSHLHEMTQTTPTVLWNDSATLSELEYAIEHGGVGATCNPVIVLDALKKEPNIWNVHVKELAKENPTATEDEIGWLLIEDVCRTRAKLLETVFHQHKGRNGRLSIQTDPHLYRDPKRLEAQAIRFSGLAPNMIVKLPVTTAGVAAIEEVTYHGVSVNATACFTLPQCVAVAEAVERGLKRRESEGKDISTMGPVCTIMVGRLDDWLKVIAEKKDITVGEPGYLEWAGVAVFKKTYRLYQQRGYRLRLLSAAFRNHMHWSELIGGDVVISPPHKWQVRFNASDVSCMNRIDTPVDPKIVADLEARFPDFVRAYEEGGLATEEFDSYGATARTMRGFLEATHELANIVRNITLPNPDTSL